MQADNHQIPGLCDLTVLSAKAFSWRTSDGRMSNGQLLWRRYTPKNGGPEFAIFLLREEGVFAERSALSSLRAILPLWNEELVKQNIDAPALYLEDSRSPSSYFVAFQDAIGAISWRPESGEITRHLKEHFSDAPQDSKCH